MKNESSKTDLSRIICFRSNKSDHPLIQMNILTRSIFTTLKVESMTLVLIAPVPGHCLPFI